MKRERRDADIEGEMQRRKWQGWAKCAGLESLTSCKQTIGEATSHEHERHVTDHVMITFDSRQIADRMHGD
jgi:hypothetical protein